MTDITVEILGTPSRTGGRRTVSTSYDLTAWVSWDLSQYVDNQHVMGSGAVAEVNIMCHPEVPQLDPETTRITIDSVSYKPVKMINDNLRIFNKLGHYHFFISELKDT